MFFIKKVILASRAEELEDDIHTYEKKLQELRVKWDKLVASDDTTDDEIMEVEDSMAETKDLLDKAYKEYDVARYVTLKDMHADMDEDR